tara:strand:+ start:322 stop:561 length:240 start_codon:yes stop_codon:yes gene_type:complete
MRQVALEEEKEEEKQLSMDNIEVDVPLESIEEAPLQYIEEESKEKKYLNYVDSKRELKPDKPEEKFYPIKKSMSDYKPM